MVKKRAVKRRSTRPIDSESVVNLIDAVAQLDDLTWEAIAARTSYNERSIRRIDKIYQAFWNRKDELSSPDRKKPRSAKKIESDTVSYLRDMMLCKDKTISELQDLLNNFRQVFVQLIQMADMQGIDLDPLWIAAVEHVLSRKTSS